MPLVSLAPTKARLVIENGKDTVLVMKVVLARGETVELSSGDRLETLLGVLRIRERKPNGSSADGVIGSFIHIAESGRGADRAPAKFQINLTMATEKFEPLLRVALSGRLPNKMFVDAGERVSSRETRGLSHKSRGGASVKVWDVDGFAKLPVTNFAMILPIEVGEPRENGSNGIPVLSEQPPAQPTVTHAHLVELVDDLLAFQSETRYTLYALVAIAGAVAFLAIVFGLMLMFR
jgi:hypothetical protein